jgi:hypothetical protein
MKNKAIMAKLKPVRVKKADPKNSKMIVVQPHVGNLEDAEIINFMVWMDMYFQQENKPEHMMQLFSTYSAIEEADSKKEKYVSCRALNQQRVEICIGENCGSSLWSQKNTAFKILVDEVINFYMECHVHGEISNRMPVSFNVVKRTMLNYFELMARKSGLVNQYAKLLNCALILHLKGTLQQAVHKDLMEAHVQIGGVLTKGALPTLEFAGIGEKGANANDLEMVVVDWQGCRPMPEDVKDVLTTNENCLELFAKYGELLSANIQKLNAKGKDKCAAIGLVFVFPGNVMHTGPPCPKKEISVGFFGCMSVAGTDALIEVDMLQAEKRRCMMSTMTKMLRAEVVREPTEDDDEQQDTTARAETNEPMDKEKDKEQWDANAREETKEQLDNKAFARKVAEDGVTGVARMPTQEEKETEAVMEEVCKVARKLDKEKGNLSKDDHDEILRKRGAESSGDEEENGSNDEDEQEEDA